MSMQTANEAATVRPPKDDDDYRFGAPPTNLPKLEPAPSGRVRERGDVRVETIDLGQKAARKRFLDVADAVEGGDPNFISPLRMERMKFLDTAHNAALAALEMKVMIAVRAGRDVGRITAHVDRAYNEYHGVKVGWFGFFESIDDTAVAHALLDEAVQWVKAKGAREIIGPNNFTTNHQCGLLVENFDRPPFVEMTYNPAYYERLISSYGFGKAKDLLAWWIDVTKGTDDPKMKRYHDVSQKVQKRYGLRIRGANMADFEGEVGRIFRLYNDSWQKNWGFVPVTEPEFKTIAADLKQIIVDSLVLFVEDKNGTPVAFSVTLPNVNEVMPKNGRLFPFGWWKLLTGLKKIKQARLMALGVHPSHRQRGVEAMLCIETALRAKNLGMTGGEIGWTLEDNVLINRAVETFGGQLDRRYRMLGIDLT
jgi:GNAT superfamily N-acetyltransferase